MNKKVAELGPGDSLGIGLAALLAGAQDYVGLDIVRFADLRGNISVFDELVSLFRSRSAIPDEEEFPHIFPLVNDYQFPDGILSHEVLLKTLDDSRIAALRSQLQSGGGSLIRYAAPWFSAERAEAHSIDWIFSQAVLEHVDDLTGTYNAFDTWLRAGGVMSHEIDFTCHQLSRVWNGHWAAPFWLWRLTRGRRPYLLNREPLSTHLRELQNHRFELLKLETVTRFDGLDRAKLSKNYRSLSHEDLSTAGAFVISQKN